MGEAGRLDGIEGFTVHVAWGNLGDSLKAGEMEWKWEKNRVVSGRSQPHLRTGVKPLHPQPWSHTHQDRPRIPSESLWARFSAACGLEVGKVHCGSITVAFHLFRMIQVWTGFYFCSNTPFLANHIYSVLGKEWNKKASRFPKRWQ